MRGARRLVRPATWVLTCDNFSRSIPLPAGRERYAAREIVAGQNPSRGSHETSGSAHIKESSDGSRNSARRTHFAPRIRLHESGAAASDREHGRQGGAGREAQFFTEPTPCGGGRAQGRAERAGFQAQFFAEPRTGGGGGPQGRTKRP